MRWRQYVSRLPGFARSTFSLQQYDVTRFIGVLYRTHSIKFQPVAHLLDDFQISFAGPLALKAVCIRHLDSGLLSFPLPASNSKMVAKFQVSTACFSCSPHRNSLLGLKSTNCSIPDNAR